MFNEQRLAQSFSRSRASAEAAAESFGLGYDVPAMSEVLLEIASGATLGRAVAVPHRDGFSSLGGSVPRPLA
jgi:hypothetical protein